MSFEKLVRGDKFPTLTAAYIISYILFQQVEGEGIFLNFIFLSVMVAMSAIIIKILTDKEAKNVRRKYVPYLIALLTFYLSLTIWLEQDVIEDYAYFGGDSWEYQSIAVNLARGNGYQVGSIYPFEDYKFDKMRESVWEMFKKPEYSFYRNPLYQFFLAAVYYVVGVSPYAVKVIQLIMVSCVYATLPLIGNYFWGFRGSLAGLFSGWYVMLTYPIRFYQIMMESLLSFLILAWVVCFILWSGKKTGFWTSALGIATGVLALVKGNTILIGPFFMIYLLIVFHDSGRWKRQTILFFVFFAVTILPWAAYASFTSGELMIFAGEGKTTILDSNNELSINTGNWEPLYSGDYMYTRLDESGGSYSTFEKLLVFFTTYKEDAIKLFCNKIISGFLTDDATKIGFWGMLLYTEMYLLSCLTSLMRNRWVIPENLFETVKSIRSKNPAFQILLFANITALTLIFYGGTRLIQPFLPFFIMTSAYVAIRMAEIIYSAAAFFLFRENLRSTFW